MLRNDAILRLGQRRRGVRLLPNGPGGGSQTYAEKVLALFGSSIVSYLPLWELSGSVANDISGNGRNGAYTAVTLGQPGIGDGRTAASFNGSTSYANWYSAGLAAAFNAAALTVMVWFKVSGAAIWTDGATHKIIHLSADGNNDLALAKNSTNNNLRSFFIGAGTTDIVDYTGVGGALGWNHYAMTVSNAADQLKAYVNGAQVGSTQTGIGTWSGALSNTLTTIGALNTTPQEQWSGSLAHAVLLNRAATSAEMLAAATVP